MSARLLAATLMSCPGTYALILRATDGRRLQVGRLGVLHVHPGYYVYVGSAFGPGGVRARVAHHQRVALRPHWHIDYLRSCTYLEYVWYTYDRQRREHQWAQEFAGLPGAAVPLVGFGASDCACVTHLFCFTEHPVFHAFQQQAVCDAHAPLYQTSASFEPGEALWTNPRFSLSIPTPQNP